jgi:hypothetical protein
VTLEILVTGRRWPRSRQRCSVGSLERVRLRLHNVRGNMPWRPVGPGSVIAVEAWPAPSRETPKLSGPGPRSWARITLAPHGARKVL